MRDLINFNDSTRLTPAIWQMIRREGQTFFADFPFLEENLFADLPSSHQLFILAYSLHDLPGFERRDCYYFAFNLTPDDMPIPVAEVKSANLTRNPDVKHYIEKMNWLRVERLGFESTKIIAEESHLAFSDITDFLNEDGSFIGDVKSLPASARKAIKSLYMTEDVSVEGNIRRTYKFSLWDKGQALGRMEKIKGLMQDNININAHLSSVNVDISGEMTPVEAAQVYTDFLKESSK